MGQLDLLFKVTAVLIIIVLTEYFYLKIYNLGFKVWYNNPMVYKIRNKWYDININVGQVCMLYS